MTNKDVQEVMDKYKIGLFGAKRLQTLENALIDMKQLCEKRWMIDHNNEQVRLGQIILGKDKEIASLQAEKADLIKAVTELFDNNECEHYAEHDNVENGYNMCLREMKKKVLELFNQKKETET